MIVCWEESIQVELTLAVFRLILCRSRFIVQISTINGWIDLETSLERYSGLIEDVPDCCVWDVMSIS